MTLVSSRTALPPEVDAHTMRVLAAVAEHGSITAAAQALGYSQPALSQHLRRTEERLGVALTTRAGRGIRLTEAGEVLAVHGRTIATAFDAAAGALADLMGLRSGRARVIGFPTASSSIVPSLLAELGREHPGVAMSYNEDEPPEAVEAVRAGQADVAITFSYPGDRDDPHSESAQGLQVTTLWDDEMLLALPADHPAAAQDAVPMESLDHETWIAGCPRCRGHLLSVADSAGFEPAIAYESDNFGAVLGMVAAGIGVALVPRLALGSVRVPDGVALRPTAKGDRRLVHVVTGVGAERVPAVAAVLETLESLDPAGVGLRRV